MKNSKIYLIKENSENKVTIKSTKYTFFFFYINKMWTYKGSWDEKINNAYYIKLIFH